MDRKIALAAALVAIATATHAATAPGETTPIASALLAAAPFFLLSAAFSSLRLDNPRRRQAATDANRAETN